LKLGSSIWRRAMTASTGGWLLYLSSTDSKIFRSQLHSALNRGEYNAAWMLARPLCRGRPPGEGEPIFFRGSCAAADRRECIAWHEQAEMEPHASLRRAFSATLTLHLGHPASGLGQISPGGGILRWIASHGCAGVPVARWVCHHCRQKHACRMCAFYGTLAWGTC